jgi:hypothetical protein
MASYEGGGRNPRTATSDWNEHRAMRTDLGQAYQLGFTRHQGNQSAALEEVGKLIERDRRFDAFDKDRLLKRFNECRGTGAYLDFESPELKRGGQPVDSWTRPPVSR